MLLRELRSIADEPNVSELVVALEQERLIHLFSPALSGQKLNQGALAKLQRARQLIPYGMDLNLDSLGLFLYFLTERLTPREKLALATNLRMSKRDLVLWQKLESRSRKLQSHLKSPDLHRPSQVYQRLRDAPGDEVLFLYLRCPERLVHDRIRNYLQKYLLAAQEINDRDAAAAGVEPGTPMFQKTKQEMIGARLDGRKWQPAARPTKGSRRAKKK